MTAPPAIGLLDPAHPGSGAPVVLSGGAWLKPLAAADIAPLAAAMAGYWRRPDPGAANPRALAFYQAAGFSEAARLPDLIAPGRVEIPLRRDLR